MIVKSYIFENDLIKFNEFKSFLFYGVNLGLKLELKKKIKANNKKDLILNLNQNEVSENDILLIELHFEKAISIKLSQEDSFKKKINLKKVNLKLKLKLIQNKLGVIYLIIFQYLRKN